MEWEFIVNFACEDLREMESLRNTDDERRGNYVLSELLMRCER